MCSIPSDGATLKSATRDDTSSATGGATPLSPVLPGGATTATKGTAVATISFPVNTTLSTAPDTTTTVSSSSAVAKYSPTASAASAATASACEGQLVHIDESLYAFLDQ